MKLIFILCLSITFVAKGQFTDPVDYMTKVGESQEEIMKDTWVYMRAAANGRNARALERKRGELMKTYFNAKNRVSQVPAFKGDNSYKAAFAKYYQLVLTILKEDYAKILDMEAIAENSFDAMEAYLQVQEQVDVKMDSAYTKLVRGEKQFAVKHGVNLVEGESSRLSEKLRRAGRVSGYSNDAFLIYFKVRNQEKYLLDAIEEGDIGKIDQARSKLDEMAREGKTNIDELGPFGMDRSLQNSVLALMDFYIIEAKESEETIEFFFLKEEMEKSQRTLNSKKQKDLTQSDVDNYNNVVQKFNEAVNQFNTRNDKLNNFRSRTHNDWEKKRDSFYKTHM